MSADGFPQASDELGPVEFLVVEFPGGEISVDSFAALRDLADRQMIRVLDLEFVVKQADGSAAKVAASSLSADLADFDGASSGVLDSVDVDLVTKGISAGSVAAVVIYEDLALLPAIAAWKAQGARVVAEGPVDATELLDALDATELKN